MQAWPVYPMLFSLTLCSVSGTRGRNPTAGSLMGTSAPAAGAAQVPQRGTRADSCAEGAV